MYRENIKTIKTISFVQENLSIYTVSTLRKRGRYSRENSDVSVMVSETFVQVRDTVSTSRDAIFV